MDIEKKLELSDGQLESAVGGAGSSGGSEYYTVKRGDTLGKIAKAFGVSITTLMALNPHVTNPNLLKEGTEIRLPR